MHRCVEVSILALAILASGASLADGIRCTQEGIWNARCTDGRGNVVTPGLGEVGSSLLSFFQGDTGRCVPDASGNATCGGGKSLGGTTAIPGVSRGGEGKGKTLRCTSNGLGVQHCTDGSILGQKCVSDGMGGTRCTWEWPALGGN